MSSEYSGPGEGNPEFSGVLDRDYGEFFRGKISELEKSLADAKKCARGRFMRAVAESVKPYALSFYTLGTMFMPGGNLNSGTKFAIGAVLGLIGYLDGSFRENMADSFREFREASRKAGEIELRINIAAMTDSIADYLAATEEDEKIRNEVAAYMQEYWG